MEVKQISETSSKLSLNKNERIKPHWEGGSHMRNLRDNITCRFLHIVQKTMRVLICVFQPFWEEDVIHSRYYFSYIPYLYNFENVICINRSF